jgi:hypothetical protein
LNKQEGVGALLCPYLPPALEGGERRRGGEEERKERRAKKIKSFFLLELSFV